MCSSDLFEGYIADFNLRKYNVVELTGSVEERLEAVKKEMNTSREEV